MMAILVYFLVPVEESGSRTYQLLDSQRRICQQLWLHLQQILIQKETGPGMMFWQAPFQLPV
jgi:hypothetical protein